MVDEYATAVCTEPMWVNESATCYERSQDHLVESFHAYDPGTWHGWDELAEPQPVLLDSLAHDGPAIAGLDLLIVGVVLAQQELGGLQSTIQLRSPTSREVASVDREALAELAGSFQAVDRLLSDGRSNNAPVQQLVYCNLPRRPFFSIRQGEILAIKGTLLANGQTLDIGAGGRPVQLSYVTCSSAEHVTTTPAEGEPKR